jgi:hypothetical protein
VFEFENFIEVRHALASEASGKPTPSIEAEELRKTPVGHGSLARGGALEALVGQDHGLAIEGSAQVAQESIQPGIEGLAKACQGVFRGHEGRPALAQNPRRPWQVLLAQGQIGQKTCARGVFGHLGRGLGSG